MNLTYLFAWTEQCVSYYGVRYAADATIESIGTTYWSSSTYVKAFIEKHGRPDVVEVRRIFDTKHLAKAWEEKVLRRLSAISSPKWLNRANNNAFKGAVMDDETRASISKSRAGRAMGVFYTDGKTNLRSIDGSVPPEFYRGFTPSMKQLAHYKKLNEGLGAVERAIIGKKAGDKTRGVPKPAGHGENVRRAITGKKRPMQVGDLNPARRPEVRLLISQRRWGNNATQQQV